MNDFEALARIGSELEEKWLETALKKNNSDSFAGVQRAMQGMCMFLKSEAKAREDAYQKILENGKFTPQYIGKQRERLDKKYQDTVNMAIDGAKKTIKNLIADKYKRLNKMLIEAPTPEQMSLLQALQMRGNNISRGELMKILPYFYRNYQGMRILEQISMAAGKRIIVPLDGDVMDMFGLLDRGGEYLLQAADAMARPTAINPKFGAFFYYDSNQNDLGGNADIYYQQFIDAFDTPAQLQKFTVDDSITPMEEAKITSYFTEVAKLDPSKGLDNINILRMTQQIMAEHPDDLDLMRRSEWGKYVIEVEELEAINRKHDKQVATDGQAQTVGK